MEPSNQMCQTAEIGPQAPIALTGSMVLAGDALAGLRRLPSNSCRCLVTSPPYWGLRDYGIEGQLVLG
jgi:site-specific DNA-methyltransferase (adenine-specific)